MQKLKSLQYEKGKKEIYEKEDLLRKKIILDFEINEV